MSVSYIGDRIENMEKRDTIQVSIPRFSVDQIRSFKPILRFLNEKDRDILYLIFVSGKKQKDVQQIIGRSQPSLCYDIKRIRRRIRFIFYLQSVFDIFLDFISKRAIEPLLGSDEPCFTSDERDILTLMFYTSSFTSTANSLGVTQVKVRYAYDKCLARMEELRMWDVYEIFVVIRTNLNIIKRTYGNNEGGVFVPV